MPHHGARAWELVHRKTETSRTWRTPSAPAVASIYLGFCRRPALKLRVAAWFVAIAAAGHHFETVHRRRAVTKVLWVLRLSSPQLNLKIAAFTCNTARCSSLLHHFLCGFANLIYKLHVLFRWRREGDWASAPELDDARLWLNRKDIILLY